ncbi:hypothetical protein DXG01_010116 [Tephrocybe rancida]|nr:hypothetical protein DXG01_010116 [Tephrocybe rancida]
MDRFAHYAQPISSSPARNLGSEFEEPAHNAATTSLGSDSHTSSDPFGFFAVENKLKILRSQQVKPRYRAAPPPPIPTARDDILLLPTPPKRRNKRPANPSPVASSLEADSMPSTPSPPKPISRKGKEKEDTRSIEGDAVHESLDAITATLRVNARRRSMKRARNDPNIVDSSPPQRSRKIDGISPPKKLVRRGDEERPRATASTTKSSQQKGFGKRKRAKPKCVNDDEQKVISDAAESSIRG